MALRQQPHEQHQHQALVLLNVNRFNRINDLLGFEAGDEFILTVHGLENIWEVAPVAAVGLCGRWKVRRRAPTRAPPHQLVSMIRLFKG